MAIALAYTDGDRNRRIALARRALPHFAPNLAGRRRARAPHSAIDAHRAFTEITPLSRPQRLSCVDPM
jgi:hypothetical protein